ncbi:GNAT family N-acetyltransferase [Enterovibrio norvegicus FF-33]|uniref:GNAT family N-acetyltransferase n=1 Tax=Enterovibrio norvegicus TaxID=188144 RepID=UPI0002D6D244|nr:GNAT family N-acetyltransferase [Enterovibrio norvegicus]OEE68748.1 GNAT family N-acetyltransferase [Enterovibrio norvegicus FF-33]
MSLSQIYFSTPRLTVAAITPQSAAIETLVGELTLILTPSVKQHLPPDIQPVNDEKSARKWLLNVMGESTFVTILASDSGALIGFFLLYEEKEANGKSAIRLGYAVGEHAQGLGYASEMIAGLVAWCRDSGFIASLSGGAEANNLASIRVLEKNGFVQESNAEHNEGEQRTVFLSRTFC